jgi:cell division protein FtsQ
VFKREKTRNYRKGTKRKRQFAFLRRLAVGFYVIVGVAGLMATSFLFILVHDVITQCDYFKAKSLKIEGGQRLSRNQIIEAARVKKGMNVLAVNLAMVRKRLLAHPWIAEAEVRREIPAKGWNPSQMERPNNRPFEAVMQVLMLGKQSRSILSNRNIKQIRVDREIGITLVAFKQMKTIVLGYHNYPLKFNMLKNILVYGRQKRSFPDFNRIDLNNVNRIVVNPVSKIPHGEDHKEV